MDNPNSNEHNRELSSLSGPRENGPLERGSGSPQEPEKETRIPSHSVRRRSELSVSSRRIDAPTARMPRRRSLAILPKFREEAWCNTELSRPAPNRSRSNSGDRTKSLRICRANRQTGELRIALCPGSRLESYAH